MKEDTERYKLEKYLSELELILNPNLLMAFKRQLFACYEEDKRDAYAAAKISNEALEIEKMLNRVRESIKEHNNKQTENFLYKCFYKDLIKLIKK